MKTFLLVVGLFLVGMVIINFILGFIDGVKALLAGDVPPSTEQSSVSKKVVAAQDDEEDEDDSGSYCRICGNYSPDIDGSGECWSCAGDYHRFHHRR